jgi:molybdenum cofactor guanylyltransferase
VLAGGLSRRLGGIPKGLELVGGQRIVDRVVTALRPVTTDIIVSASDEMARKWLDNAVLVIDSRARLGGLSGVEAAVAARGDSLVVAWDMPFVTTDLLELLLREHLDTQADVVVPESESPYGIEPFCAFYGARILRSLSAFLDAGGGPARDFLGSVEVVHRVPISTVRRIGDPERLFFSVNTPDDLARANEMTATA